MELKNFIPINTWFFLRLPVRRRKYIEQGAIPFNESGEIQATNFKLSTYNIYFIYWYFNLFEGIKKYIHFNETQY